ncbi:MAG: ribosomal protein S18-alanine N-acetyltransferase [Bacteroidetes bacterium]|nr:ribosomal protein S18-alanine N-acetyltransferase [Bacteroidota bacterium]MBU1578396.1 ribosomal protein S18-alanine N-acetyltransferase [Bacteroidota bacterium]MBU2466945.1 ribosomal protein S18-alanine N-acetyltransferase [Bacteroidota bacterium]MBU2556598.1 ribosomal protein S18-alanine N-acetyltransferase [Bacteroidota bacterium]
MNDPVIRRAAPSDLKQVMEIETQSFQEDAFHKQQMRYLLHSDNDFLVAETDSELAAYMVLLSRKNSRLLRIYALAVSTKYRGQGIARLMLNKAVETAKNRGYTKLTLEVKANNQAAISLYEQYGFQVIKTLPGYYKDGSTGLKMTFSMTES